MIQDIGTGRFHNEYRPEAAPEEDSQVLFYRGREILVKQNGQEVSFLTWKEVTARCPYFEGKAVYLFSIDGTGYFLPCMPGGKRLNQKGRKTGSGADFLPCMPGEEQASQKTGENSMDADIPQCMPGGEQADGVSASQELWNADSIPALFPEYSWQKIELLRTAGPREAAFAGVTGMQLYDWYRTRRFCPACGEKMQPDEKERMMRCPVCGNHEYPKICPAVIVGVTCGDRLLLTKYAGRAFKRYALIAGFAEIGEPIEDTVRREVMEEVGLKIKNLRYYKSQPWSFTDTLLMGFFAEVDGDSQIVLDTTELAEGRWCTREEVPENDGLSLTREMMTVFKEGRI